MISEKYADMTTKGSIIREFAQYASKRAAEIGKENVYNFTIGNPSVPVCPEFTETLERMLKEENPLTLHGYSPTLGIMSVREAVADSLNRRFGMEYTADDIFMTSGAAGAIAHAIRCVTKPGDEVIVPAFTYVAAAEVVSLLGLIPVWVDVDEKTFNINPWMIESAISPKTRAIVVVHLFGQCCDMEKIRQIAEQNHLYVVEDNAQSLGAEVLFSDGTRRKAGTIAHIGTTSFFPSKPLACYGDGGAVMTSDDRLAERIRMIANHGQLQKYHHKIIGCNSRLDTLQAAVLDVKLPHLEEFTAALSAGSQAL